MNKSLIKAAAIFWLVLGLGRVHRRFARDGDDDLAGDEWDLAGEDEALRSLDSWRVMP